MREVTKEEFINKITDYEQCYHILTYNGQPYLQADIEEGGEIGLRIEEMDFKLVPDNSKLDTFVNISDLVIECRGYYVGGINYIEYATYEEAEKYVLQDFFDCSLNDSANEVKPIYIISNDNDLNEIISKYHYADTYILIDKS